MIKSVQFKNFKVLRDATLPLSRFTLTVGPNGSGKSTALQALEAIAHQNQWPFHKVASAELRPNGIPQQGALIRGGEEIPPEGVAIVIRWEAPYEEVISTAGWTQDSLYSLAHKRNSRERIPRAEEVALSEKLQRIRIYFLDPRSVAIPFPLQPNTELEQHGTYLVGVLDRLRDQGPEQFEALNEEVGRWFPEFDRILFDTLSEGRRVFLLRTRKGQHKIPANDLSQGTLLALTILTLGYLLEPPSLVGLEEPDRGIHPRLLRQIQDALYRLSYPENFGEKREPVQVIATTHSPYLLDLYKDHPEEIVIAQKTQDGAVFERLSEQPHIMEILGDAPLGDVWYSGVLGGVPTEP